MRKRQPQKKTPDSTIVDVVLNEAKILRIRTAENQKPFEISVLEAELNLEELLKDEGLTPLQGCQKVQEWLKSKMGCHVSVTQAHDFIDLVFKEYGDFKKKQPST